MLETAHAGSSAIVDTPPGTTPAMIPYIPTPREMQVLTEIATTAAAAGFGSAQACLIKLLFGREIGLPPTIALDEIDLIPGNGSVKAALNARSQVAIVRRRGLGDVRLIEYDDKHAVAEAWRTDDSAKVYRFAFGEHDARRANLLHKDNFKKWPQSMYIARAQSLATKALFQEVFLGLAYTPDELGAETDEDGRPLRLPLPVKSAITRKDSPPAITPEDAQAATRQVAEQMATVPVSADPPVVDVSDASSPPVAPPAAERNVLRDQIKRLAGQLALAPEQWRSIRQRFCASDREMTVTQLTNVKCYLYCLWELRWARQELAVPAQKWAEALQRRGATVDTELSADAAREFADKLARNITPFKHAAALNNLRAVIDDSAAPTSQIPDTAGNG